MDVSVVSSVDRLLNVSTPAAATLLNFRDVDLLSLSARTRLVLLLSSLRRARRAPNRTHLLESHARWGFVLALVRSTCPAPVAHPQGRSNQAIFCLSHMLLPLTPDSYEISSHWR